MKTVAAPSSCTTSYVVATGESQARWVVFEDIPVSPGSEVSMTLSAGDVICEVVLASGDGVEPESVGEIDASDIFQPTSVDILVCNVELFYGVGWLKNADIRDGLLDKLYAAQESLNRGKINVAKNQLRAFINQTQSDKNVDPRAREYLTAYARYIMDNL